MLPEIIIPRTQKVRLELPNDFDLLAHPDGIGVELIPLFDVGH